MTLLEHFQQMQEMASHYLSPAAYKRTYPNPSEGPGALSEQTRMDFFVSDVLYMLDSAEQRAAERNTVNVTNAFTDQIADLAEANKALTERVAVCNSDAKRAIAKLDAERAVQNDLRSRLMETELAYAKLRGYLEGVRDSAPPVLVPQQRQTGFEQDNQQAWEIKPWYHR